MVGRGGAVWYSILVLFICTSCLYTLRSRLCFSHCKRGAVTQAAARGAYWTEACTPVVQESKRSIAGVFVVYSLRAELGL